MLHMKRARESYGSATDKIGYLGELIGQKYLKSKKYKILATRYVCTIGELDIISVYNDCVHVVEVKTYKYDSIQSLERSFSHETWRPEELVDDKKENKLRKIVEYWVTQNSFMGNIQIDVLAVRIVPAKKYATVLHIENI